MTYRTSAAQRRRLSSNPESNSSRLAYAVAVLILLQLTATLCIASVAGLYLLDSTIARVMSYQALQSLSATRTALDSLPPTPLPIMPPTDIPTESPTPELPTATATLLPTTEVPTPEVPTATFTPFPPPTPFISPLVTPTYGPNFTVIDLDGYQFASDCTCDQGDTLSCENFSNGPNPPGYGAQACFLRCRQLAGFDVHGLDLDNDSRACEWGQ